VKVFVKESTAPTTSDLPYRSSGTAEIAGLNTAGLDIDGSDDDGVSEYKLVKK